MNERLRRVLNSDRFMSAMLATVIVSLVMTVAVAIERSIRPLTWRTVNLREIEPPPAWRRWYVELELCVGTAEDDFDTFRWAEADSLFDDGWSVWAMYDTETYEIWLEAGQEGDSLKNMVVHEMLHHLHPKASDDGWVYASCVPDVGYEVDHTVS